MFGEFLQKQRVGRRSSSTESANEGAGTIAFKSTENAVNRFSWSASGRLLGTSGARGRTTRHERVGYDRASPMTAKRPVERRQAPRRFINRLAKIQSGVGTLPRDCLITDISTGGVRLHVEGYEVPNEFVLLLSGDGLAKECNYEVVWRLGHEIGARFVGLVRRPGAGAHG